MTELALNILDISNNSVRAGATEVKIEVSVCEKNDILSIAIEDNGCGMSPEFLERVSDPFATTRTSRKVGMGIPLFKMEALMTGGTFDIKSEEGKGTRVEAQFGLSHIDRPPLGDLGETMAVLIGSEPQMEFILTFTSAEGEYIFDTREIKGILEGVDITSSEIINFLKQMIDENISKLNGGRIL